MKKYSRLLPVMKSSKRVLPLAVITLSSIMSGTLIGCSGTTNGGDFASNLSSVDVDQDAGFTITPVFDSDVANYTHIFGAFNSSCAIAPNQSNTTQSCMVNVKEQDLFMNEMKININIPAGMCKYLEEIPYVYYNHRPGQGPTSFEVAVTDGNITSCKVNGVLTGQTGGFCSGNGGQITAGGKITCNFDYSTNVPAGPNCCIGNYSYFITTTTNTVTAPVPPATTPTTTTKVDSSSGNGSYGGVPGSCMAGPGASKLWPTHVAGGAYKGYPGNVLIKVPDNGYAATLENRIPIIYVTGANDTISMSNFYFNWTSYRALGNAVTGALPAAVAPSVMPDGFSANIASGHDAWEFLCEDESKEIKHRIKLYVNEWDTTEQYVAYINSAGASGNPSNAATDQEGQQCVFGASINYGYCNDYFSLRDYVTGTYGTGTTYGPIGRFPADVLNDSATASSN